MRSNLLDSANPPKGYLTIITSTLNAESTLQLLVQSLRDQSNTNFEWIIADGGSTDGTIEIAKQNGDIITHFLKGPDFGIYHGLNRAIAEVRTPYYLVLGADDTLNSDAVFRFNESAKVSAADFISARVSTSDGGELRPARGNVFRYGHLAYVSQHSVGTLIKTDLHRKVGLYSNRFPIAADRHFILKSIERYGASVEVLNFVCGTYDVSGTSNTQFFNTLLDIFKVDYELSDQPMRTAIKSLVVYAANLRRMGRR